MTAALREPVTAGSPSWGPQGLAGQQVAIPSPAAGRGGGGLRHVGSATARTLHPYKVRPSCGISAGVEAVEPACL
jgi:hypothetical protein